VTEGEEGEGEDEEEKEEEEEEEEGEEGEEEGEEEGKKSINKPGGSISIAEFSPVPPWKNACLSNSNAGSSFCSSLPEILVVLLVAPPTVRPFPRIWPLL
jgi:hypothetical protein